jgi:PAS domain-containing protein
VLREREERLKTILDSLQAGIVCINAETYTIVDANLAAIEMIGAPLRSRLLGMCVINIFAHDVKLAKRIWEILDKK